MTTFTIILSLLSGVALFLFGMSLMGDGLKKVAGNKLELVLYKLTNTPLKGVLLGTAVTAITWYGSYQRYSVIFSNDCHGDRFCKLRYDETETGNRYHHGSQHRNECDRLDFVSVVH